jgi:hypothetical protein
MRQWDSFHCTAYITTIRSALYKTTPFESSIQQYQAITDAITQFLRKENVAFNDVNRIMKIFIKMRACFDFITTHTKKITA